MEECIKTEIIEKTLTRTYGITLSDDNGDPKTSRVGGKFVWPEKKPFPEEMLFLAQINLEELPANKIFPEKGVLQFFIKDDEHAGLDGGQLVVLHDSQDSFEIRETVVENTPILAPCIMKFNSYLEAMSFSDYRFPANVEEAYGIDDFNGYGTKLLGYPGFCQEDPRSYSKELRKYDALLLQLDGVADGYMMWGDSGVGNFFINGEALRKHDFSDVFFTWDCY